MIVTVTAMPPLTRPNNWVKLAIICSAMPDRSSIRPMKMNMGRATSTQFCMVFQRSSMASDT